MDEESLIADDMREMIGFESQPVWHKVEMGSIAKIIRAMGDQSHPLWDKDATERNIHAEFIAPPAYLMSVPVEVPHVRTPPELKRQVGGGGEWVFFRPVRTGDVLTARARVADIFQKRGKQGPMVFVIYEIDYERDGEKVASHRVSLIRY